jgi:hypothetical protein
MTAETAWIYVATAPSTAPGLSPAALNDAAQPATTIMEREAFLQIDLADFAALRQRLAELEDLSPGWLAGEGERPQRRSLERARIVLRQMLRLGVPRPRVYPTPEGGVQAEWTIGTREVSLTFEPDAAAYATAIDVRSGREDELQDGDADQFVQFVLSSQ